MLLDESGLDDAPAVCCTDDPEGDGATCEDDNPAVASIGGGLVPVEGCLDDIVRICWCGRNVFKLDRPCLG